MNIISQKILSGAAGKHFVQCRANAYGSNHQLLDLFHGCLEDFKVGQKDLAL